MDKKNWKYRDKLYIDEIADNIEESIDLMYSSKTPDNFYITINSGHPLDSYGANWEKNSECVALNREQLQVLIDKLQLLLVEDKAKYVLYGSIDED